MCWERRQPFQFDEDLLIQRLRVFFAVGSYCFPIELCWLFWTLQMPAGKRPRSDHEEKLIGQRIRLRRRQMKMTQAELGAALNPRRTSQQIQKYESGKNRLLATTVLQLSAALQIPVTDLLGTVALNAPARSLDSRAYNLVAQLEHLRPQVRKALLKVTRALARR